MEIGFLVEIQSLF